MKKSILMIAALATMVACSKDETVETVAKVPIAFGTSHVDNSTRAAIDGSYKGTNLVQSFKVYGTVKGLFGDNADGSAVNIFNGVDVTKPNGVTNSYVNNAWSCSEVQYWIPDAQYNFTAIVDGDVKDGSTPLNSITVEADPSISKMPVSITYDAGTQKDLLLATATAATDVNGVPNTGSYIVDESGSTGNKLVSFTFDHLLAKAKFTVKNNMTNSTNEYSYKVTGIKITNAQKTGVYTIDGGTWAPTATPSNYTSDASLLFGNATSETTPTADADATAISEQGSAESNYERLMIPADYTTNKLSVTFTYELSVSNTPVYTNTVTKTAAVELVKGHAYNFVIVLDAPGKEIKFTVQEVNDWETNHDNNNSTNDDITLS